ncbi:MAG: tetratricopeptide repeat protein [Bacteroidetes bacterium]|nr:tetratricopeptide repeat protein [Bacteroidota bacterium]
MNWAFLTNLKFQSAIVFVFPLLVYVSTLGLDGFVLDDALYIKENDFTKKGLSGIKDHLSNEALVGFYGEQKNLLSGGRYRPLAPITYSIEYALYGFNPWASHAINALLYALLIWLLYKLFREFVPDNNKKTIPIWLLLGLLVYAAHPLHTEVVANIKGRDQIMAFIFVVLATFSSLKAQKNFIYLAPASFWFFLGLLSKESTVTFLPIIPLSLYFFKGSKPIKLLSISGLLLLTTFLWFGLRAKVIGDVATTTGVEDDILNNPFLHMVWNEKHATIIYTFLLYLKLHFLPFPLTHDYYPHHVQPHYFSNPSVIISALILMAFIIISLYGLAKRKAFGFWAIFFLATYSISSNFFFVIGTYMNERFVFEASLAICISLAYGVQKLIKNQSSSTIALSTIALVFGIMSVKRSQAWNDNYTLFTTDVKVSKNSIKGLIEAGGQYYERADTTKNISKRNELLSKSIPLLTRAIKLDSLGNGFVARNLLGNAYITKYGPTDSAAKVYKEVLDRDPNYQLVLNNIMAVMKNKAYNAQQRIQFGISFQQFYSKNAVYYYLLGQIHCREMQDLNNGIAFLEKSVAINPKLFDGYADLGVAYGMQGDFGNSNIFFLKAYELRGNDANVIQGIILNYRNLGNAEKASEFEQKLNQLSAKN